jgi:hypothetical protein
MMVRPRFLVSSRDIEQHRELSVLCGSCGNAGDKKPEKQVAYCLVHKIMVSTTRPVLCKEFEKK